MSGSSRPVVSIVVPVYQNARVLEPAIRSALDQTFRDLEVCLSDHHSSDGSGEVIRGLAEADPRVRVIEGVAPGGGAARNWRHVTDSARGEFLKLLPADDLLAPEIVDKQVRALRQHPSAVLASCKRDLIDVHDAPLLRGRGLGTWSGLVPGRQVIRGLVRAGTNLLGEPGCVLFRRSVLTELGGWQSDQPYLIDQHTYMRALEHGDLVAIPETLAAFRISDTQWSRELAREQSGQARRLHADYRRRFPTLISRRDAMLGDARATATAWGRRLAYIAWSRRLNRD